MRQTSGAQEPPLFEPKAVFQRKWLVDQETLFFFAGFVTHTRAHPRKIFQVALLYSCIKTLCNIVKILQAFHSLPLRRCHNIRIKQFPSGSAMSIIPVFTTYGQNTFSTHVKQSWALCGHFTDRDAAIYLYIYPQISHIFPTVRTF